MEPPLAQEHVPTTHTHSRVGRRVNICVEQEEAVPLRRVLVGVDGLSCGPRS